MSALIVLATATASAQEFGSGGMGIFTGYPLPEPAEGEERDEFGNLEFDESALLGSSGGSDVDISSFFDLGGSDRITTGGTTTTTVTTASTPLQVMDLEAPYSRMSTDHGVVSQPFNQAPVPEPGLMIAGGVGLLAVLRRRKKKAA